MPSILVQVQQVGAGVRTDCTANRGFGRRLGFPGRQPGLSLHPCPAPKARQCAAQGHAWPDLSRNAHGAGGRAGVCGRSCC